MAVIWELDFYSRPILDEQGKKLWEVVVCESPQSITRSPDTLFRYAKFCSATQVNSVWLREALEEAIAKGGHPPNRIRFFRRQMNNMIKKACGELGIDALPSRRTYALNQWLQERVQKFYPTVPGYQEGQANPIASLTTFETALPQPLPDALIGQQWAFVNLEAGAFDEMSDWAIDFSEAFPLQLAGITPTMLIPGVIIFSSRALPMAGWISGLEMAFLRFVDAPARLILETGAAESWLLANLSAPQMQTEAQAFETAKQQANGVHFLAVQTDPRSETFAGFWLLQEVNLA
ncbi:hypothetical protein BST81_14740 [Leptolyngbya sp. 'hensonii']|uniref:Tab2/Atab2 family RNA-binding protein n=1 Tax=Leptolyngbya sp. 'hensonii' TaxID=1922337 RepID=UPI00094F9352|nr:Tab2/Atab2 family RNA-binding protein [Leptolyngbya sp. 'hensonii']OLP17582.1 hypothetical protein BST81_14740 [Leptolyngbya sp. 'hensonii']